MRMEVDMLLSFLIEIKMNRLRKTKIILSFYSKLFVAAYIKRAILKYFVQSLIIHSKVSSL